MTHVATMQCWNWITSALKYGKDENPLTISILFVPTSDFSSLYPRLYSPLHHEPYHEHKGLSMAYDVCILHTFQSLCVDDSVENNYNNLCAPGPKASVYDARNQSEIAKRKLINRIWTIRSIYQCDWSILSPSEISTDF